MVKSWNSISKKKFLVAFSAVWKEEMNSRKKSQQNFCRNAQPYENGNDFGPSFRGSHLAAIFYFSQSAPFELFGLLLLLLSTWLFAENIGRRGKNIAALSARSQQKRREFPQIQFACTALMFGKKNFLPQCAVKWKMEVEWHRSDAKLTDLLHSSLSL